MSAAVLEASPNNTDIPLLFYEATLSDQGLVDCNGVPTAVTDAGLPQYVNNYPWTEKEAPFDAYHSTISTSELERLAYGLRHLDDPKPGRHRPENVALDASVNRRLGYTAVAAQRTSWFAENKPAVGRARVRPPRAAVVPTAAPSPADPRELPATQVLTRPAPAPRQQPARAQQGPSPVGSKSNPEITLDADDAPELARIRRFYQDDPEASRPDRDRNPGQHRPHHEHGRLGRFIRRGLGAVAISAGTVLTAAFTYTQLRGR